MSWFWLIGLLFPAAIVWGIWSWRDGSRGQLADVNPDTLARLMKAHSITPAQIADAYARAPETAPAPVRRKREPGEILTKVFAYLGSIFVLGGVAAYIAQFWSDMSPGMRIAITLGFGIGLTVLSCIAMKENKYPRIVLPLIIAAAVIETGGWGVFVDEMFPHTGDVYKAAAFITGAMAVQEWLIFALFRRTSLFFFSAMFSYGFLYNALHMMGMRDELSWMILGGSLICVSDWTSKSKHWPLTGLGYFVAGFWFNSGIYEYVVTFTGWKTASMITGISMCLLAWGLAQKQNSRLSSFFYLVGSAIFYSGLFAFVQDTPYELLYLLVAVGMMYGHTVIESGAVLFTSTLAIIGFIGYFTHEHFLHSTLWPIALILMGVAFFAVGTMALKIRRRAALK